MSGGVVLPSSGLAEGRYIGLSLDVARKAFSADAVIGLIGRLGELGMTALHLHLTESQRIAVRLPGIEHLAPDDAWSARDVSRIVEAAGDAGVALVPEVDLPSHATALLRDREHLRLRDRDGHLHADRLDVSVPEALEYALLLLEGASALFPGDTIHLGGDEYFAAPWEDTAAQDPLRFLSLIEHARREVGPEGTALDSYALFMNALGRRAIELGRTPMMWNDHVVPASDQPRIPISRDIVLDVWIRWRAWTPSVLDLIASGYRAVTSDGDLLYLVLSADDPPKPHGERCGRRLEETFAPRRFMGLAGQDQHIDVPPAELGQEDPVLGASMSMWCDAPDVLDEADAMTLLDTWLVPFARTMGTAAPGPRDVSPAGAGA